MGRRAILGALGLALGLVPLAGCQKVGSALVCGDETFHVAFEGGKAMVTAADKSNYELPMLEQPAAAGAAKVYSNGDMTFTRLETAGQPPLVRFARGKLVFQECKASPS